VHNLRPIPNTECLFRIAENHAFVDTSLPKTDFTSVQKRLKDYTCCVELHTNNLTSSGAATSSSFFALA